MSGGETGTGNYTNPPSPPFVSRKTVPVPQSLALLWSKLTGKIRAGRLEPPWVSAGGLDSADTICQYHHTGEYAGIRFGNWELKAVDGNLEYKLIEKFTADGQDEAGVAISCLNHESVHWLIHALTDMETTTAYDKMFWSNMEWTKDEGGIWHGKGGVSNMQMWEWVYQDGIHIA